MRTTRTVVGLVVMALAGLSAWASDLDYSYVQLGYGTVNPDEGDSGDGASLGVSFGVVELVHVFGGYGSFDFEGADSTSWQVGVGVNPSLTKRVDLVFQAGWVDTSVDVDGLPTLDDNGYRASGGVRARLGQRVELAGSYNYLELDDAGSGSSVTAGVLFDVSNRFTLGAAMSLGDDASSAVGLGRFRFGKR